MIIASKFKEVIRTGNKVVLNLDSSEVKFTYKAIKWGHYKRKLTVAPFIVLEVFLPRIKITAGKDKGKTKTIIPPDIIPYLRYAAPYCFIWLIRNTSLSSTLEEDHQKTIREYVTFLSKRWSKNTWLRLKGWFNLILNLPSLKIEPNHILGKEELTLPRMLKEKISINVLRNKALFTKNHSLNTRIYPPTQLVNSQFCGLIK